MRELRAIVRLGALIRCCCAALQDGPHAASPGGGGGGTEGREQQEAAAAAVADLEAQLRQLREDAARTQEMLAQDVRAALRAGAATCLLGSAGIGVQVVAVSGEGACAPHNKSRCYTKFLPDLPVCLPAGTFRPLAVQLTRAKEESASSRTEAARARAEAEFERERGSRLAESLEMQVHPLQPTDLACLWSLLPISLCGNCLPLRFATLYGSGGAEAARPPTNHYCRRNPPLASMPLVPPLPLPQRQQLEGLMAGMAKQAALVSETERRLAEAQVAADEARDKVRQQACPRLC